ncbi:AC5 protein [Rhynchosia yellow mosaic virus]|uniref:AC5 protein n=1 Tax=Rhynchosia yellow mosaic virus TaxID=529680 RepID=C7TPF6_9GEMI|nr:AC5 protein [Rhynchosia yellow mosaic virus]CAQ53912.1 AC5 protein [Rhynchosia yellow mosaic virus]CAR64499.1 AC5 protein [Rhynchosia yellow mosaic virus]
MVLILGCFLMVIHYVVVYTIKPINYSLFLARILTTGYSMMKLAQNLITITQIVLHRSGTRLIIIHVKNLSKIHRRSKRPPVSNELKHHTVGVILGLDVFIHPNFPCNVNRLDAKTFADTMSNTVTTCHIRNAYHLTNM